MKYPQKVKLGREKERKKNDASRRFESEQEREKSNDSNFISFFSFFFSLSFSLIEFFSDVKNDAQKTVENFVMVHKEDERRKRENLMLN